MTKPYLALDTKNSKHMKWLTEYLRGADLEYREAFRKAFPNIYRKLKKEGRV